MAIGSGIAISFCPRIKADAHRLIATTSWWGRVVTLGLSFRSVVVDRQTETVCLEQCTGWFFRRRQVFPFVQIGAVTYGYEDLSPFAGYAETHNAVDRFVVGLRIHGAEEVRLFDFVGDGTFTNGGPLPDWWYWDEILMDFVGSQERESKLYVQLISKLIGVPITPSTLTRE